ncbi:MAG: hypothetical protein WCL60_15825 [Methylococcales bacterium]
MTKLDDSLYFSSCKKIKYTKCYTVAKAGLTQTAIADALDVSKEAVSQWLKTNLSQLKVKGQTPFLMAVSGFNINDA